jgi:cyclohexadieny/prephenate dehydrogenase
MNRVAILGLGLMGGSLGLALKARGFRGRLSGYARRRETREQALQMRAVDEVFEKPEDAVRDADFAILCVPILSIPDLAAACRGALKPGAVLTDVGSTKAELVAKIGGLLKGTPAIYVGSHPIAGSEQQGLEAAKADLYEGAVVVVTPAPGQDERIVSQVKDFWKGLGAVVRTMAPDEHDRVMARTSHLPHLVSAALAAAVGRDGGLDELGRFCGSGFRDTTRIAEGSSAVWHDIIASNRGSVAAELRAFESELKRLADTIDGGDFGALKTFLEEGRARRRALMRGRDGEEQRGGES